ncbi:enhancer of mRNA-decapping protein 3-like isoform X2 [Tigriopus californicus]|nr:enhancer of mRNA-decapping protein 3-like isoform X2 [Tigriopus californicus]
MNDDWLGKTVSISCGSLGHYQGVIKAVHLEGQTITLKDVFQNGKPCKMPSLTLSANSIEDINFLEVKSSDMAKKSGTPSTSTVMKRKSRPVAENLASAAATKLKTTQPARFSPAIQAVLAGQGSNAYNRGSPRKSWMEGNGEHRVPNRRERERMRDEECFQEINEVEMSEEFDFESNLALFDKRLVLEEISDNIAANQPDVVRLVDCNKRKPEAKYRNDENVLMSVPAQYRPIETGEEPPPGEYVTDSGLIVPAISIELRNTLEAKLKEHGISAERMTELMARSAVELAIHLFGGAHRLNPSNNHQVPLVVILVGPNRAGVFGLATARHLDSQGVRTAAYLPDVPHYPAHVAQELNLYKLSSGKVCTKTESLPQGPVDLVINAMEDHDMWMQERQQPWLKAAQKWILKACPRVNVMALDPPHSPDEALLPTKICLVPGLPLWQGDQFNASAAKIYSANMAIPKKLYQAVGIKYSSPYGAKTVIPLHKVS